MERDLSPGVVVCVARMRLNIDFSPIRRRTSARSLVLFAGALIALAGASWTCVHEMEALRVATHRMKMAERKGSQERVLLTPVQTEAINRAIRQLNLPWDALFSEIESRLSDRISLLSLEPDAATRILRIQAEAKSPEDMLDFVSSLNDRSAFQGATLVRHEVVDGDRNRPIRFLAEVIWQPD